MASARYLEIDSTYRDRTVWPNPSEFEILISQSGVKGKETAIDPVCDATPTAAWTSNNFNNGTLGRTVTLTVETAAAPDPLAGTNTGQTFIAVANAGNALQQLDDYYVAAVANDTTITSLRRINFYRYLGVNSAGDDRGIFGVDASFGDTFDAGDTIVIADPTDIAADPANPQFFVPAGRIPTNGYTGNILYNESLNEYRSITGYEFITHLLQINTVTGGAVPTWLVTHNYSIRRAPPMLTTNTTVASTTTSVVLSSGIPEDDFYNNQFIRIRANPYDYFTYPAPATEMRRIVNYVGATRTATVSPPFSASVGALPSLVNIVEVMQFTRDNVVPFPYTGSMVSQQEQTCYEIELLDLILPNVTMNSGFGGRIAFYPYVYVQLANVSGAGAGLVNVLWSNNPNSTRMMFRAPVDDVQNPLVSAFVKIDGDGTIQTLKFKPNDNLKFSVHLPNGELYKTLVPETFSPAAANPAIQISALFSLKRL